MAICSTLSNVKEVFNCVLLTRCIEGLLSDPTILDKYCMSEDVKKALLRNVEMRLTPQPVKVARFFFSSIFHSCLVSRFVRTLKSHALRTRFVFLDHPSLVPNSASMSRESMRSKPRSWRE